MLAVKPHPPARAWSALPSGRWRRRALAGALVCWIGAASWSYAAGERIGEAREVRSEVLALAAGAAPRQVKKSDPLEKGLKIQLTRRDSYLLAYIYRSARGEDVELKGPTGERIELPKDYRIDGVIRLAGKSEMELGKTSLLDRIVTTVDLVWGELRVWLRPGRTHDVECNTPEAALGFKGTAVRVLVDPRIGTFVGVDDGVATVQAHAGGGPVELASGQWVLVPPGGLPTRPAPLDGVDILDDPPLPMRDFTTQPPTEPPR